MFNNNTNVHTELPCTIFNVRKHFSQAGRTDSKQQPHYRSTRPPYTQDAGPPLTHRHIGREPMRDAGLRQAPPPQRRRTDAFESAGPYGTREHSAAHQPHSHNTYSHSMHPGSGTAFCQPITTVTASASVTVAVHPCVPGQSTPYPCYPSSDSYHTSEGEYAHDAHFPDPHVPFTEQRYSADSTMGGLELQDLEFTSHTERHTSASS